MNDNDSPKLGGGAPTASKLGGGGQVAPTAPVVSASLGDHFSSVSLKFAISVSRCLRPLCSDRADTDKQPWHLRQPADELTLFV